MSFLGDHLLSVVTFLPLVGALLVLALPRERTALIARVATAIFGLGFLVSLPLWTAWWTTPADAYGYRFAERLDWIPGIGAAYSLGVDGISMLLVLLTTLLGLLAALSSWSAVQRRVREYYALLLVLQTGMLGVFVALDFFLFYVFWEVML